MVTDQNPQVFINLFGRDIHWYGLTFAGAFLLAVLHWSYLAKKTRRKPGFGSDLGIWIMVFGVLGARLMYTFLNWKDVTGGEQGLLGILRVDQGGLVFHGGFIGGVLAVFVMAWFYRKRHWHLGGYGFHKESVLSLGDFIITAVPLGHALGRVGCFLHGCCYGHFYNGFCAMNQYTVNELPAGNFDVTAVSRFPIQLVEALGLLLIYVLLFIYYKRHRIHGRVFALYLILYGMLRFVDEFGRGDPRETFFGFDVPNIAQGIGLTSVLVGAILWVILPRWSGNLFNKSANSTPLGAKEMDA